MSSARQEKSQNPPNRGYQLDISLFVLASEEFFCNYCQRNIHSVLEIQVIEVFIFLLLNRRSGYYKLIPTILAAIDISTCIPESRG